VNPKVYEQSMEVLEQVSEGREAVDRLLALAEGARPARRAVAAALDRDRGTAAWVELVRRAGLEGAGGDGGEHLSAERLLRLARGAEERATRRRNPVPRNEGFTCGHCGAEVQAADGGVQRNHCPVCLYSRHVDEVPGDRAAECGGLMAPVALEQVGPERAVIRHRCDRCGAERRCRAALGIRVQPDDLTVLAGEQP
jgi:RNHCP domain